jgi:uncharacterized protein YkwD
MVSQLFALRHWRVWLQLILLQSLLVVPAAGAETYVGFVNRMTAVGSSQHAFQPAIEQQLFGLLNAFRRSKGLSTLGSAPGLQAAARAHALDMAQHNFMGHTASTGHNFDSRMHALRGGAMVLPSMGENAAMMYPPNGGAAAVARKLFQEWIASPPHYHTLVSRDYLRVATGVAIVNGKAYADQIFIGPEVVTNMMRAK